MKRIFPRLRSSGGRLDRAVPHFAEDIEAAAFRAIWNAGHRYLITSARFTDRFMNGEMISKDRPRGREFNENAMKHDNNFIRRMCKNRNRFVF